MGAGSRALGWYYGSSVSGLYDRYIEDPLERELPKTSRGERYSRVEMKRMLVGSTEGADKDTGPIVPQIGDQGYYRTCCHFGRSEA